MTPPGSLTPATDIQYLKGVGPGRVVKADPIMPTIISGAFAVNPNNINILDRGANCCNGSIADTNILI